MQLTTVLYIVPRLRLSGAKHTLQQTTEVKYLGLILDKGLTWKAQLRNVMNKAYGTFWTCKGTLGKT
jgi:hypothetical protein